LKAFEDALAGAVVEIRGRCHFGAGLPADYFEQLTAETIETSVGANGYPRRVWKTMKHRPNHYLDCRVYNHAAAERLKLETLTADEWAGLAAERWAAPDRPQTDLFDQPLKPTAQAPAAPTDANAVRTDGAWINSPATDWL
jgi:phage terminase large subunit GpA-like protein